MEFRFEKMIVLKYIRISPKKMRRFLNYLKGYSIADIKVILKFLPYKSSFLALNLFKSLNFGSNILMENLYIDNIIVNEASFLKRFCPRAQGKAFPIKHRYSNIISVFLFLF